MQAQWTGERLETSITNETMLEHLHRYAAALPLAKDKQVLDIACGEGYGCHLLASVGAKVTGVDIDKGCIEKAMVKYRNPAIEFRTGVITSIPAADNSFDLVTCFETLEHVDEQEKTMEELKRVLKPGGVLIISTPDKANYTDKTGYHNPFHKKELYRDEFRSLVKKYFSFTAFYSQRSVSASLLQPEHGGTADLLSGTYDRIDTTPVMEPVYWVAFAADRAFEAPRSSAFLDQRNLTAQLGELEKMLKNTITYRTGHFLLAPFKFIRSLFNK